MILTLWKTNVTEKNEDDTVDIDPETWPRAELIGGPMDGIKIFAPLPEYRRSLAIPMREETESDGYDDGYPPDEDAELAVCLHWYVPMTRVDSVRKLSVFFYAYAGETAVGEEMPDADELLDRSLCVGPQFPEDTPEDN